MKAEFHSKYEADKSQIEQFITGFDSTGKIFGNGDRNVIKLFDFQGRTINIKSFKIPNIFNRIAYRFFRKSKARRSFEYASKLIDLGIGTPHPIAFYEFPSTILFGRSYYISEHLNYDLTFRELSHKLDYPDHEKILRSFTRFTFKLHENGIHFLDHSPGNTLIQKVDDDYRFYLVDLNRMDFKNLDFEERIHNFRRLTVHKSMVETMSDEYSKCSKFDKEKIFELMWKSTQDFQEKFHRKKRLKKKLKFWK